MTEKVISLSPGRGTLTNKWVLKLSTVREKPTNVYWSWNEPSSVPTRWKKTSDNKAHDKANVVSANLTQLTILLQQPFFS